MEIRELIRDILQKIEPDTYTREGLVGTPNRVARAYDELFGGYSIDPKKTLGTTFEEGFEKEMIIVRNISFSSHCEHHMVPFIGKVHIGYIPDKKMVGLSKMVRLVDCLSRRLQVQERLTAQIAQTIEDVLDPLGVMVVVEAEHLCMKIRGVEDACADTVTSAVKGAFRQNVETRAEFLSLIRKGE